MGAKTSKFTVNQEINEIIISLVFVEVLSIFSKARPVKVPSTQATLFNHKWSRLVAGIFINIPVV